MPLTIYLQVLDRSFISPLAGGSKSPGPISSSRAEVAASLRSRTACLHHQVIRRALVRVPQSAIRPSTRLCPASLAGCPRQLPAKSSARIIAPEADGC